LHNNSEQIIIHGDIKPANCLLTAPEMHVRLSDFGLALARETAASSAAMSSTRSSTGETAAGTWQYKAPEMYRSMVKAAQQASRSTDIYALGTLMWEVLANEVPWSEGEPGALSWCEADRLAALREIRTEKGAAGIGLNLNKLAMDTPSSVRDIITSCLAFNKEDRPSIDEVRLRLEQEHDTMLQGEFDVFLSYAWGANDCRKPLTDQIYLCLKNAGYRVWMDSIEMGLHLQQGMTQGIIKSTLVVVLMSPDYVSSRACNHELREANRLGKPIVVCMVEPIFWRLWKLADGSTPVIADDSDIIGLAKLATQLYADCSEASTINWADKENITTEQRRVLTHGPSAIPRLKMLIEEAKKGGEGLMVKPQGGAEGGGGGGGEEEEEEK